MTAQEREATAESKAEREMDRADRDYLSGRISEAEYDAWVHGIELRTSRSVSRSRDRRRRG